MPAPLIIVSTLLICGRGTINHIDNFTICNSPAAARKLKLGTSHRNASKTQKEEREERESGNSGGSRTTTKKMTHTRQKKTLRHWDTFGKRKPESASRKCSPTSTVERYGIYVCKYVSIYLLIYMYMCVYVCVCVFATHLKHLAGIWKRNRSKEAPGKNTQLPHTQSCNCSPSKYNAYINFCAILNNHK